MSLREQFKWQTPLVMTVPAVCAAALILVLGGCSPRPEPHAEAESREVASPVASVASPATTGEVPAELLESILDDLTSREGLQRKDVEVERSEYVIWPDGSLGCPEPGVMYTQAQIAGYWVVLRAGEKQYDYRASERGQFRRCKGSFKVQLPVG